MLRKLLQPYLLATTALATVLSSSKLETCSQQTDKLFSTTMTSCNEKLVLLLSVESRQMMGSQTIFAELSQVESADGSPKRLSSPLLIDISKTRPQYVYPLVYERDFPFYAYEQVI